MIKIITGIFLTALTVFAWEALSWSVLGWHERSYRQFRDESQMAEIFTSSLKNSSTQTASGAGVYVMPFRPNDDKQFKQLYAHSDVQKLESEQNSEVRKKAMEAYEKALADGPFVYAVIRPGKREISMANNLLLSFFRSLICAGLLAAMLSPMMLPYGLRIAFTAAAGLFAGLACDMPMWIWFETPGAMTLVNMLDHFITWVLGGAVLGLFVGKDVVITKGM
ncbi:MAG: hypothetical protein IPK32_07925 [Verrucomicrobiaceae bacterium]|nr:hypothetical protein [Verrucomicrobiaceae bacterium]